MDKKNGKEINEIDIKGLKKILQIFTIILKLKSENKLSNQGYNDRISVAKEIYQRNIKNKEFIFELNKNITNEMKFFFELVKK